jgi:hypothetical protein
VTLYRGDNKHKPVGVGFEREVVTEPRYSELPSSNDKSSTSVAHFASDYAR